MTAEQLTDRIRAEGIVSLDNDAWLAVADAFEEVERHNTFIAGDLVIARRSGMLVAVETPTSRRYVLRKLDEKEVRAFVQDRLDTYERMWDGCGCKVEYDR
jgi:hypothetical protein